MKEQCANWETINSRNYNKEKASSDATTLTAKSPQSGIDVRQIMQHYVIQLYNIMQHYIIRCDISPHIRRLIVVNNRFCGDDCP